MYVVNKFNRSINPPNHLPTSQGIYQNTTRKCYTPCCVPVQLSVSLILQHAVSYDIMYMYVVFHLTIKSSFLACSTASIKPVTNICQHVYNQVQLQLNRTGTLICLKSESNSGSASTGRLLLILCRPRQEGFFLSFLPMCRWLLGLNSRAGKRTPKSSSSVEKFI